MQSLRFLAIFAVLATSCFKHVYNVGTGANSAGEARSSKWHHHFLFGLINASGEVDVKTVCPSGNATIVNYVSFLNGLLQYILGGFIWSPTTVDIYCADNATITAIPVSETNAQAIVHSIEFRELIADIAPEKVEAVLSALELPASAAVCAAR